MNCRDLRPVSAKDGSSFKLTLMLTVEDAGALWGAAADRALAAPGMTVADVLDTIGPREVPAIIECISMLTSPVGIPGCTFDSYEACEEPISRHGVHLLPIRDRGAPSPSANG